LITKARKHVELWQNETAEAETDLNSVEGDDCKHGEHEKQTFEVEQGTKFFKGGWRRVLTLMLVNGMLVVASD